MRLSSRLALARSGLGSAYARNHLFRPGALRLALCLFAVTVPAASAQQGEPFRETVDVDLVEIDVFVADRRGRPVRGLTPRDFELFVDGVSVEISNFAEYRVLGEPSEWVAGPGGREEAGPGAETAPLTVVLYLVNSNDMAELLGESRSGGVERILP